MAFFKDKENMFNHRAERFDKEADRYAKKGNTEKVSWAKDQAKENRNKADKYKDQKGW